MSYASPVTLTGSVVTLSPLSIDDHDGLVDAVQDGELWKLSYTAVPEPAKMDVEIHRRISKQATGSMLPFTIRLSDSGRIVGMTTFMNIDQANRHLEIGSTWMARSAQRTGANTEGKLLLLTHAFEGLGCLRVEFRTHWLNRQSREAIERLGAKLEGVLRQHMVLPNGTVRDTCVYALLATEWPAVKAELERRLANTGAG